MRAGVPGWAGDEDGTACDLALLDHLQHNSGGLSCSLLTDKALRCAPGFQGVLVDAKTADVGVRGYEVDAP